MRTSERASRAMAEAVQVCRREGLPFEDIVDLARYYGIELALRDNRENQLKAAEELHMHRNTLGRLINELGVPKVPKSVHPRRRLTDARKVEVVERYLETPKRAQA